MTSYLDTNVLLRFIVRDHAQQAKLAEQWFREGEQGKRNIVATTLVVAEVVFVLSKFYRFPKKKVSEMIESFLSNAWMTIPERDILLRTSTIYGKTNLHFVDCYLAVLATQDGASVLSFDKGLKKKLP